MKASKIVLLGLSAVVVWIVLYYGLQVGYTVFKAHNVLVKLKKSENEKKEKMSLSTNLNRSILNIFS